MASSRDPTPDDFELPDEDECELPPASPPMAARNDRNAVVLNKTDSSASWPDGQVVRTRRYSSLTTVLVSAACSFVVAMSVSIIRSGANFGVPGSTLDHLTVTIEKLEAAQARATESTGQRIADSEAIIRELQKECEQLAHTAEDLANTVNENTLFQQQTLDDVARRASSIEARVKTIEKKLGIPSP